MSKKLTILIIILTIALGSGILYYLLGGKGPGGLGGIPGLPFGEAPGDDVGGIDNNGTDNTTNNGETPLDTVGGGTDGIKLTKITSEPVAGVITFINKGSTYLRYVDRATGHVSEVKLSTMERSKILNITRPKIYEALWRKDGTGFVERTLDADENIVNTSVSLVLSTTTSSTTEPYIIRSTLLKGEVGEIKLGFDGGLIYNLTDSGVVATSNFIGEKPKTLFTLPFTSWRITPVSTTTALLTTKPSVISQGYSYLTNLNTGKLTKILGPLSGLSAKVKSDSSRVIYSYLDNNKLELKAKDLKNGVVTDILPRTLADKCVWSKKVGAVLYCGAPKSLPQGLPDSWYQGEVSFADSFWRFNTETNTAEELYVPQGDSEGTIDVHSLEVSPDEDYLVFINKSDLSLWVLKLPL